MARKLATGIGILATVMGLVACGSDSTEEQVQADPYERIYGSPEQNRRRQIRLEKKVRECMVLLGWEYTPVDPGSFTYTAADQARDREQFGYGISTYIGKEDELGGGFDPGPQQTDPNQAYVETLSPGEQEAYYEDLYGSYDGEEEYDPATAPGCQNEARRTVFGDDPINDPEVAEDLNAVYEATTDDPRLAEAQQKWSKCMADQDLDYATQDEIYTDLSDRLSELMGEGGNSFDGSSPATVAAASVEDGATFDTGSESGFEDDFGGSDGGGDGTQPTYDEEAMAELQAYELRVAKADFDCAQKHLVPVQQEITNDAIDALLLDHPELAGGG